MLESDPRVLVVDDEPEFCRFVEDCLAPEGYGVTRVHDGREALDAIQAGFDLIISDFKMKGLSGMEVIEGVRARDPSIPVVLITAFGSIEQAVEAMRIGAYDYLTKPISVPELRMRVRRALEARRLRSEVSRLRTLAEDRFGLDGVVARSRAMRRVVEAVRHLERSTSYVLVSGESGTGKELIARALHLHSPLSEGPFVAVNCAAIPEPLLESELFGHVRGAFTDATSDKPGLFQAAHGGTLFLDEVGEMPATLQAKLLRVLEDRSVRRLGATRSEEVHARVLSATNRNLSEEVDAGRFRGDLFYRLNVVEIHLPALRERRDDIPALVERYLATLAGNADPKTMSHNAMRVLLSHDWPGNIRQLHNALEHAVALSTHSVLEVEDLPASLTQASGGRSEAGTGSLPEGLTLRELEDLYIDRTLERTGGNRSAAAAALGIDRKTLYGRLRKKRES